MPGFGELLDSLCEAWDNERESVADHAANITAAMVTSAQIDASTLLPDRRMVDTACQALLRFHDPANGGFGTAPKFPSPLLLDVLLRHHVATGDGEALEVTRLTLDRMAAGGIYDHLGGGFARYSVDDHWAVPHFEKMLYDNALLVPAYVHGWQLTGSADYRQVVIETIEYVMRDLRLAGGGIASAEDADSEGEEGLFYVWSYEELVEVLTPGELEIAVGWYGVSAAGNFEGVNVLHRPDSGGLSRSADTEALRAKLFQLRKHRIRPGLDDKVLVEWNALMISALAEAGAALGEQAWVTAAVEVMEFLEKNLVDPGGRWYRSWQIDGGHRHLAYAADYAALVDAYTRLGEATGQPRWHKSAVVVTESMLELFWDDEAGGLFTTGTDAEELLVRRKELFDSPVPSANSNGAFALLRLAAIHGRSDFADRADRILRLVSGAMATQPQAYGRLLSAFDLAVGGMFEIVIAGDRPDLLAAARARYLPSSVVLHGEPFESPVWEGRTGDRAYVCQNYTCQLPADTVAAFVSQIAGSL